VGRERGSNPSAHSLRMHGRSFRCGQPLGRSHLVLREGSCNPIAVSRAYSGEYVDQIAKGALCERILRGGLTGHRNHQKQHAAAKERFRILVAHQCRASSKTAVLVDLLLRKALMQVSRSHRSLTGRCQVGRRRQLTADDPERNGNCCRGSTGGKMATNRPSMPILGIGGRCNAGSKTCSS
jgi:hypothetical protein